MGLGVMTAVGWSSKDSLYLISKGCNYREVFRSAGMRPFYYW